MFNSPWRTISVGEVYETAEAIPILSLFGLFDDQLRISRLIESGSSRLPNLLEDVTVDPPRRWEKPLSVLIFPLNTLLSG